MKIVSVLFCGVVVCCCILTGCGPGPTQPTRYSQLKSEYLKLSGTLQKEVESFRGKTYKRPVTTAVFTLDQYKSVIAQSTGPSYTPAQKKLYNDIFKAEGLLKRNDDYFAGYDSAIINETGGFYKDGSDSVYVILDNNASNLTWWDSVALFHELVHALQDQYIGLTALDASVQNSDQSYGVQYTLEGEAELLAFYYGYRYYGVYPSSSDIMTVFDTMAVWANHALDSIQSGGGMLMAEMPLYWAYYSCGPRFINGVAGRNWQLIDANIYPRMPIKTHDILHPELFPVHYGLDFNGVYDFLDSAQVVLGDADELGEVLMNVLFREWDFPNYKQLSSGLLADNIVAYRTQASDTVRIAWYTYWQDAAQSTAFFSNIADLIDTKRNITLPGATQQGDTSVVNDTVNKVYLESNAGHVFVIERYQPDQLQNLIAGMREVKWIVNNGALAKSTARSRGYPFIDKSKLTKGWHHRAETVSMEGVRR